MAAERTLALAVAAWSALGAVRGWNSLEPTSLGPAEGPGRERVQRPTLLVERASTAAFWAALYPLQLPFTLYREALLLETTARGVPPERCGLRRGAFYLF
jgi:hypothetical protein